MRVALIIPFYNDFHCLPKLLDSIKNQEAYPEEIIIIDDHSINPLAIKGLNNLTLLRNERNMGPAFSRNRGIKSASSDLLVFTDSDCILPKSWIKEIREIFEENTINVLAGPAKINKSGLFADSVSCLGYPAGANLGFEKMWHVFPDSTTHHVSSCNFAIRKNFLFRNNLFFNEKIPFACCEDLELSDRIISLGHKIFFSNKIKIEHKPVLAFSYFLRWHFIRGKGSNYYKGNKNRIFLHRFLSLLDSLKIAPGLAHKLLVLFLFLVQMLSTFLGFLFEKLRMHIYG